MISKIRYQRYWLTPASTLLRCLKDVSLIQAPVQTFLQHDKLVSLTYVPVGTSRRRLKLVGFIYVPVRRHDNVIGWSRTLILVIKMDQLSLGTRQQDFRHHWWFSLIKVPASISLKLLKMVGFIQVLVVTFLRRGELVSRTQVLTGTSL